MAPRILVLVAIVALAGWAKHEAETPIAIWESPTNVARHVKFTLYSTRSSIEYGNIPINVVSLIRDDTLVWIAEPDEHGRPQAGTVGMPFARMKNDGSLVISLTPALFDDSRLAPYVLEKIPSEPTRGK